MQLYHQRAARLRARPAKRRAAAQRSRTAGRQETASSWKDLLFRWHPTEALARCG